MSVAFTTFTGVQLQHGASDVLHDTKASRLVTGPVDASAIAPWARAAATAPRSSRTALDDVAILWGPWLDAVPEPSASDQAFDALASLPSGGLSASQWLRSRALPAFSNRHGYAAL